jgi:hypothetical protein
VRVAPKTLLYGMARVEIIMGKGRYECCGNSMGKNVINMHRNEFVRFPEHSPR